MFDEITREFLIESSEALAQVEGDLVALEEDPSAEGLVDRVFRALHTIKGTSSFLGYPRIEGLGHAAEGLLSELRAGTIQLSDEAVNALLETVDVLRSMLGSIELTGLDGLEDHAGLRQRLQALRAHESSGGEREEAPSGPAPPEPAALESPEPPEGRDEPAVPKEAAGQPREANLTDETLRVDVAQLDQVLNLVSELVLERNHLVQLTEGRSDEVLSKSIQRLNLITSELQERLTRARMQPVEGLWQTLPRLAREVARQSQKQVRLELSGGETELDRTVLTAIRDPLTHLIRNAIDHGIEAPEARVAAGKPEAGLVRLRALHTGGLVTIEISDDGGGIDVERVAELALERGVITPERAQGLSRRQLLRCIFAPGFSTNERVTSLSGRGVGMDVVRANVESIGGSIDIHSVRGEGTTFVLRIPLTLAIVPVLVVHQGDAAYAIPQASLHELVHVEPCDLAARIDTVQDTAVIRLRGELLPLIDLGKVLQCTGHRTKPGTWVGRPGAGAEPERGVSVVIMEAEGTRYGLVVDDISDTREIVVKPLSRHFQDLLVYAGATLMGDGSIALILDVNGLARRGGVRLETQASAPVQSESADTTTAPAPSYILVEGRDAGRIAIATEEIIRLEEVQADRVQRSGTSRLIQRPDGLLAVDDLSALLDERRRSVREPSTPDGAPTRTLVVCHGAGTQVGLLVERVLDVVHADTSAQHPPSRFGIRFSAVIDGHITEVLDLDALATSILSVPSPLSPIAPDPSADPGPPHARPELLERPGTLQ